MLYCQLHQMCSHLLNEINKGYKKETLILNYKKILTVINPILPHFANECLEMIGEYKNINWPTYDEKYLHDTNVTIVLQINGKRALFNVKKNLGKMNYLNKLKMTINC